MDAQGNEKKYPHERARPTTKGEKKASYSHRSQQTGGGALQTAQGSTKGTNSSHWTVHFHRGENAQTYPSMKGGRRDGHVPDSSINQPWHNGLPTNCCNGNGSAGKVKEKTSSPVEQIERGQFETHG